MVLAALWCSCGVCWLGASKKKRPQRREWDLRMLLKISWGKKNSVTASNYHSGWMRSFPSTPLSPKKWILDLQTWFLIVAAVSCVILLPSLAHQSLF